MLTELTFHTFIGVTHFTTVTCNRQRYTHGITHTHIHTHPGNGSDINLSIWLHRCLHSPLYDTCWPTRWPGSLVENSCYIPVKVYIHMALSLQPPWHHGTVPNLHLHYCITYPVFSLYYLKSKFFHCPQYITQLAMTDKPFLRVTDLSVEK